LGIENAEQATNVVRKFLTELGWGLLSLPQKAERDRSGSYWNVYYIVGFQKMKFKINAFNGTIEEYGLIESIPVE